MAVKIIRADGEAALVQWREEDGSLRRATVPLALAQDAERDPETIAALRMGIPYGVPWESILEQVVPDRGTIISSLAGRLREAGVWTEEDAALDTGAMMGALAASYGAGVSALRQALKARKQGEG